MGDDHLDRLRGESVLLDLDFTPACTAHGGVCELPAVTALVRQHVETLELCDPFLLCAAHEAAIRRFFHAAALAGKVPACRSHLAYLTWWWEPL